MKTLNVRLAAAIVLIGTIITAALPATPARAINLSLGLASFATGLTAPLGIVNTGVAGDTRLFVVEQAGVIKVLQPDGTVLSTPFLDINSRVKDGGGEQGLLGLAFHPRYASNGFFYVYYNNNAGDIVVSRFSRDATNPNIANPASEEVVLTTGHPGATNHNGGQLAFSPVDGDLYIGTGDGGGAGDTANNAQNKDALLGKILRISLDGDAFPGNALKNYVIPGSNPFVNKPGADEIWDLGLRNPWRFSFDRVTHHLIIGDVGQSNREEVDLEPFWSVGGKNYGWRCYEGTAAYNTSGCGSQASYDQPIGDYGHTGGACSITGGYMYRGQTYPQMQGHYIFADYCSGDTFSLTLRPGGTSWEQQLQATFAGRNIASFGEDIAGELYAADITGGTIYRVQEDSHPTAFPVYRLANYLTRERLFTASTAERDVNNWQNGWSYENAAFMTTTAGSPGAVPIYRLANYITKERLFTPSAPERDAINGRNGWVYEGIAFYGLSGGPTPVYRLANFITKERLFTASAPERDAINGKNGWVYEGVAWQAP